MSLLLPQAILKRLPDQVIGGVNVTNHLDAIVAMFASATYFDGSARTAGTVDAWSLQGSEGAPLEAVSLQPPPGSPCSARVLIAGENAVATPQMWGAPTDTWLANALLAGVSSNGGTLATWDGATPLGASARWTKFARMSTALGGAAGVLRGAEWKEGILIHWTNGANQGLIYAGAIFDPGINNALNCETDQRIYGLVTGGSDTINTAWESANNMFMCHSSSANKPHIIYMAPGSATVKTAQRVNMRITASNAASRKANSNGYCYDEGIRYEDTVTGNSVGTLRGIYLGPQGRTGRTATDTQVFHALGGSAAADCDCIWYRSL